MEEIIEKGINSLKEEMVLVHEILYYKLNRNIREADSLRNEYIRKYNKTNNYVSEYFSDISKLDEPIELEFGMSKEEIRFLTLLEDCREFMEINRYYEITNPNDYNEIEVYTSDYLLFNNDYKTPLNLMKLISWYFEQGRKNNIKNFVDVILDRCLDITGYRNYLIKNELNLPVDTNLLTGYDESMLLTKIKLDLIHTISSTKMNIDIALYTNEGNEKYDIIDNNLLFLTLYTANIINMINEYQLNIDTNYFINEVIAEIKSKQNGKMSPIYKAVEKGIDINKEYTDNKIKTKKREM